MGLLSERVVVGLTLALWITVSFAGETAPSFTSEKATAKDITTQMANVYKSCKSYSDTGMVKTTFFTKARTWVNEKPFSTAFVRPDQFRFEYNSRFSTKSKLNRYIIWAKDKKVRTWWDIRPGIKKNRSLKMAIAGATGVSGSSAHTIPVLLMPELGGRSFADFKGGKRIDDALLNTEMCYRIQGNLKPRNGVHTSITLWISKKTFLIHQIDQSRQFPKFRTKTITTYRAKLNIEITQNDLAFNAPEKDSN